MKLQPVSLSVWLALLCWLAALPARAEVVISEFLANNNKVLADADGEFTDWIELHNTGNSAINLGGWHLTDSKNNLLKWTFPNTNLNASAYLVIFASGKNRASSGAPLHTSFKLDASSGYLALVQPGGAIIASEFAYPRQIVDVSYGTFNGTNYYYTSPTPNAANPAGLLDLVAQPKFSQPHGFYQAPFNLELLSETEGAAIRYTTNGTIPNPARGILYTGPITVDSTTVIRAMAYKDGYVTSRVDTASYLFTADIINQSPTGLAPAGWPSSWGGNTVNYGMDPDIVNSAAYKDTIQDDLKTIPSYSIVTDLSYLFNASSGIYANPGQQGINWERLCSLELIYPDGRDGFQINAGLRIRGGYSRSTSNPKHAFRLFFRTEYGDGKLEYPMFAHQNGAESFECFDIRTFQNYSWSFEGDSRGVFMRDMFSRDTQIDMGQPAERGDYYHLYLNGQYWGLYNSDERAEADYAASYFGGSSANYDVIKVEAGSYNIKATDGNMTAWTSLYNQAKAGVGTDDAYEKLRGNNPDGTRNPDYPVLLDVDNLIDYMLIIYFGGNLDAPISNFLGNSSPNNWYGIRDRTGTNGFRFFAHDSEHTLLNVNENRLGPYSAGNSSVVYSSPQWLLQKLWANTEFKMRMADRVQRHFFNGGALTPEAATARFLKRKSEIDRAVVGESARWGDSKTSTPLTRNTWISAVNNIVNNYFPRRTGIVLNQLVTKGLYPSLAAPVFSQFGGAIQPGFQLAISNPAGTVYYTLDGSDPRLRGGALSAAALAYSGPITLNQSLQVRARVLSDTNWSALVEAPFTIIQTYTNVVVSELMYHPAGEAGIDADAFEFLELKNLNSFDVDLSGVYFTNGIRFAFPQGAKLAAGQFAVLASNPTNFASRYPGVPIAGVYSGNLANGGETITLLHAVGTPLFTMIYDDQAPWPQAADGQGFSLVTTKTSTPTDPNDPANWRASTRLGGSPGADDPISGIPAVVINEILTHKDAGQLDAIELYNPGSTNANISGWYLTNDRNAPNKYAIPGGTILAPGEYRVFDESQFAASSQNGFHLDADGGEVYLFSADAAGNMTGYADGFAFGAAELGVTFGRHTNSVNTLCFAAQTVSTLGSANSGPRTGPIIFNEINYDPAIGSAEFIELRNITGAPVALYDANYPSNPWRINGLGFDFPTGAAIAAQGYALVVGGNPEVFRTQNGVPDNVPIFGPYFGALQDNGETLRLQKPGEPQPSGNAPYITIDEVAYSSLPPWPSTAAGMGASLERVAVTAYGNDPASWKASFAEPTPGIANDGNRRPIINAGQDQEAQASHFPLAIQLNGTAKDDGYPAPAHLTATWSQLAGPGYVTFSDSSQLRPTVSVPGQGTYTLRLTVNDGELQSVDDLLITVSRPSTDQTLLTSGSIWKYYDQGSDLGTAWRAPGYNDSAWASGKAQLGYGDGDESTTVSYGPNSGSKYPTTYFRRAFTVADPSVITSLTIQLLRDDGAVVYLNGTEVFRSNMPEDDINYGTYASSVASDADETSNFYAQAVDPARLVSGNNVLAVEVHQANAPSSDISFDLQLEAKAFPQNQAPITSAGNDQEITLPATARLAGSFSDDGLPSPPGVATNYWSQQSGPGSVTFAAADQLFTSAAFTEPGTYVLRLTTSDGAFSVNDELTVTVNGAAPAGPTLQGVEMIAGNPAKLRVQFQAEAGRAYTVQWTENLEPAHWQTLQELSPLSTAGTLTFEDEAPGERPARYYRVAAH